MVKSRSIPDLARLKAKDFQVVFRGHAKAILGVDFPQALVELENILIGLKIPIEEIIASGGGEAKGTQRLRRALNAKGWTKTKFEITKVINKRLRESISHEVDHVKAVSEESVIALEIEWNNKDPFFDRDLENFKRLHAEGAISVGVIVTRGETLQDNMPELVRRFVEQHKIRDFAALERFGYTPTPKQKKAIVERTTRANNPLPFAEAFTDKFVSDKFGQATTHWRKLTDRVNRGVGNPCPLLLIGLPASIVSFDETASALKELKSTDEDEE
jgi:hypothetical protein